MMRIEALICFVLVVYQQALSSDSESRSVEDNATGQTENPTLELRKGALDNPSSLANQAQHFQETSSNPIDRLIDDFGVVDQPNNEFGGGSAKRREPSIEALAKELNEDSKIGDGSSLPQVAALQGYPQSVPLGGRGHLARGGTGYLNYNFPNIPSCGMCSRERNLCQIISGIFTRTPLPYGYSLVTPIPKGVCNVSIVELKPSKNFFALRRPNSAYVLNGNWKIQAAGSYAIAGTIFDYSPADRERGEKLESSGPLLEPIDLMIIYQSPNPGIKYEYRVPLPDIDGQQSRGITAGSNPALRGSGFGLNIPKTTLTRHQPRIHSGLRQNLSPNSRVSNAGVVSFQRQSGRHPLLTANLPSLPPGSSNRPPFINNPQGSGGRLFPQRGKPSIDPSGKLPIVNKNWGSSYIPPRSDNLGASRTSNKEILQVPFNKISHQPGQGIASHFSQSSGTQGILPQSEIKPILSKEPFQGVLNTEPKNVPFYPIPDIDSKSGASKTTTGSDFSSPNIAGHSFTPRTTSVSSLPGLIEPKHHARHRHGSTYIVPGPAVGGNGFSVGGNTDPGRNSLVYDGETSTGGERRRSRKKGKRKKGKRRRNRFVWVFKGLTECSKPCGGGNQTYVMSCVRRRKNKVVSDRLCQDIPRPENKVISCNLKPCPARWVPGDWSSCSTTCGYGIQTRLLACKQEVSASLTLMVTEGACLGPKEDIKTNQVCHLDACPIKEPHWNTGEWYQCSSTCGNGTRTRSISCFADGRPVNDSMCQEKEIRPDDQEFCHMGSCVVDLWYFSQWSAKCSETCGEGVQTRKVFCLTANQEREDLVCPIENKPDGSRSCIEYSDCGGTWLAGPWTECSVTCGSGRETRAVACLVATSGKWKVAPNGECQETQRPSDSRACILETCLPEWYTSQWEECSSTCGGGLKERLVKCYDPERRPSGECSPMTQPPLRDVCNTHRCPLTFTLEPPPLNNFIDDTVDVVGQSGKEQNIHLKKQMEETHKKESSSNQNSANPKEKLHKKTENSETKEKNSPDNKKEETTTEFVSHIKKSETDNNRPNELEVIEEEESLLNVIPGKDAQGDESISESQEEGQEKKAKEAKDGKGKKNKKKDKKKKKTKKHLNKEKKKSNCIDRIKNCHLVFRARLCPLKYYNKLCCSTCQMPRTH